MAIPVLYEDRNLVVVDKPAGLASIPVRHPDHEDLHTCCQRQLGQALWVVHRLDRDVSGVLLFAKHARTHRHLSLQFERRRVDKHYLALVYGRPVPETGRIRASIRAYGSGRMGVDARTGKPSETHYEVRESQHSFSLVQARPATGRRHQLRVHFYHRGHPIVGDPRYGDPARQAAFDRLMLHAQSLSWQNEEGETLTVTSPPPPRFNEILSRLGFSSCDP